MKIFTFCSILLVGGFSVSAQDFLGSSSYFMNPFSLNTAYSAPGGDLFVAFQANKYTGSQSEKGAEYISFGTYYGLGRGLSSGLRMNSQSLGMINYQGLDVSLAYMAGITEDHYLSFSLAAGLLREKLESSDVKYSPYVDQDDPLLNRDNVYDHTQLTLGGGFVYNVYKFQLSYYMPYLVKGNESLKIDFNTLAKFTYTHYKSIVSVENYVMYRYFHDGSGFYDGGLLVGWSKTLWLNLAYRSTKSVNTGVAFENSGFKVGYSYNHPFGEFNELITGKHELTVTYSVEDLGRRRPYFFRKTR